MPRVYRDPDRRALVIVGDGPALGGGLGLRLEVPLAAGAAVREVIEETRRAYGAAAERTVDAVRISGAWNEIGRETVITLEAAVQGPAPARAWQTTSQLALPVADADALSGLLAEPKTRRDPARGTLKLTSARALPSVATEIEVPLAARGAIAAAIERALANPDAPAVETDVGGARVSVVWAELAPKTWMVVVRAARGGAAAQAVAYSTEEAKELLAELRAP